MLPQVISFLDLETTGTSVTHNRIIEVGIVRVENNKVIKKFKSLVNPESTIDNFITKLTGINQKEVDRAPTFYDLKNDILETVKDSVIAAHNVRFDYGFLRNEFRRQEIKFSQKHFCTVRLAQLLYPGLPHYNLDSIISHFNLSCKNRHRAFDDAFVLWKFYQQSMKQFDQKTFEEYLKIAMKRPSLPNGLTEDDLDALPESPGVYIFFGETKAPLYIGKSINIRERVASHFLNDHNSSQEMDITRQITRIETQTTAGELGALFLESTLIKTKQPLYNRQLRYSRHLFVLQKTTTAEGYHTFTLKNLKEVPLSNLESVAGIFKSKKQATDFLTGVAKDNKLCLKLIGIEKTKKSCFGYHLGSCKGACIGKESFLMYNVRFDTAFVKYKIKPWPFSGAILIKEEGDSGTEYFLFDKWCFLGSFKSEQDLDEVGEQYDFDYDTYKILHRFIQNPKNISSIKLIKTENS